MKAGTSSLAQTLHLLPNVSTGRIKEFDFFLPSKYATVPLREYHNNFDPECQIWGEIAPNYSKLETFPDVAKRIYEYNPNAKIIYIKRDPIERALSELKMHLIEGQVNHETTYNWFKYRRSSSWKRLNPSISREIKFGDFERNYIIQNSRYEHQIEPFKGLFGENVMTFSFEELISKENNDALKKLIRFIGISPREEVNLSHTHSSSDRIIPSYLALELAGLTNKLSYAHLIHRLPVFKPILIKIGFIRNQKKNMVCR